MTEFKYKRRRKEYMQEYRKTHRKERKKQIKLYRKANPWIIDKQKNRRNYMHGKITEEEYLKRLAEIEKEKGLCHKKIMEKKITSFSCEPERQKYG